MELELVPPYPDEPLLLGGIERFGGCSQLRCRAEDGGDLATVFGSGNKQQRLSVLGQLMHPRQEGTLDAFADR